MTHVGSFYHELSTVSLSTSVCQFCRGSLEGSESFHNAATRTASTFSGSGTRASKNPTTSLIRMFSSRKSSRTSKPPSNNSVKSPRFLNGPELRQQNQKIDQRYILELFSLSRVPCAI